MTRGLLLLAHLAFISLGLPDSLLGVGWPSLSADLGVPLDAVGFLLIVGTVGYVTSSVLAGFSLASEHITPIGTSASRWVPPASAAPYFQRCRRPSPTRRHACAGPGSHYVVGRIAPCVCSNHGSRPQATLSALL